MLRTLFGLIFIAYEVNSMMTHSEFCYNHPECGPSTWEGVCKTGIRQSPVSLTWNSNTPIIYPAEPILFSVNYFVPQNHFYIQDNGHTVQVHLENSQENHRESPFFVDGPNSYVLAQIHLHWGNGGNDTGSEHKINNEAYPMEIHLVHYSKLYNSLADALERGGETAVTVLGIFVDLADESNVALHTIDQGVKLLLEDDKRIHKVPIGEVVDIENEISVYDLIPSDPNMQVFRYKGSLTTPPCTEKVQWIVFKEPIKISKSDLLDFTRLPDLHEEELINNFRPVQPIGGRIVEFQHMR